MTTRESSERAEWINPPGVYAPVPHYSQVARAGQTLYISGQLGLDASGQLIGEGDARAQARQAWQNLIGILAHFGATPRQLVKTTTFITHWAYRPLVGEARDEVFPEPPYPPSTLVVVQGLAEPRFLVEIEAIAVL
ncbi:MAG: RidA family protein [Chloroflexi bacterium]|nr:RidA family protein [Chloroflexota bacterium]